MEKNHKIKLTILIDVLDDINGGAERQVYELIRHIDRDRFEVLLAVLHQRDVPSDFEALGSEISQHGTLKLETMGLGVRRIYGASGLTAAARFARVLKERKVDAILTFHFASDIWGTLVGKMAGVPVIISSRRDIGFWRGKNHIAAYKCVNRWVTKIMVVSSAVRKMVTQEEGVAASKIEVVHNGVDLERFDAAGTRAVKEFSLPAYARPVCCVGNFNHQTKGHIYLIEAMKEVVTAVPGACLVLVGDGPLKKLLRDRAHELGIVERVLFLGKRPDVPALLAGMEVCVLPSLTEGLSNALLEYMAAKKPVVATAVGGNTDVIQTEKNGLLVPAKSARELAGAIIRLMTDRLLASRLAEQARHTVEHEFELRSQLRKMEDVIVHQLAARKAREKSQVRVMHLVSSGGLFGAERVLLDLAQGCRELGIESCVAAIRNIHNPHLEVIDEAKGRGFQTAVLECRGRWDRQAVLDLRAMMRDLHIDILHAHNYKANFFGAMACQGTGIPLVATNHLWTGADWKLKVYEMIDSWILRRYAIQVVAVSKAIKQDMVRWGVRPEKIEVIFNGIRSQDMPAETRDLRLEYGIPASAVVVGVVARLSPEKGHEYLFEAALALVAQWPELVYFIVGEGPLRQELQTRCQEAGLQDKVIFAGYHTDMPAVYKTIDIVAQPSLGEGLPMTLLEAMSLGKPVIATRVGGVPDLVLDGQTGLLIDPKSPDQIAEAVQKLLRDKVLRQRLGDGARAFVRENFSMGGTVAAYHRVYRRVLGLS